VLQLRPLAGPHEIERLLASERRLVDGESGHAAAAIDACRIIAKVAPTCVCDCADAVAADEPSAR
jgi:hypothetical protein